MNANMACRFIARRVHALRIGSRLHFHKVTFIPCSREYSSGTLLRPDFDLRTKWNSDQDIAAIPTSEHRLSCRPSTLDPSKFTAKDVLDLTGRGDCEINAYGGKTYVQYKTIRRGIHASFPPGTKGIFYFTDRTNVHPVAGDVRFRVFPPMDAYQDWRSPSVVFADGKDLVDFDGSGPWRISLLSIMVRPRSGLLELLKQDGYISQAAEEQVESLRASVPRDKGVPQFKGLNNQIIENILDPFSINLGAVSENMMFLQQERITPYRLAARAITQARLLSKPENSRTSAYSGTVLVRFEMVRHDGQNRIVLRVLKFIEPPNPGDVVFQKEGELLKKYNPGDGTEEIWMARPGPRLFMKLFTPSSMKLLEETYIPKATV